MVKSARLSILCSLAVLFLCSNLLSQRLTEGSLRGLKSVAVLVSINHKEGEFYDNLKDQIKTTVELKLRQAGMKVLSSNAESILSVHVIILKLKINEESDHFAYAYESSLLEDTSLKRNKQNISCPASKVWYDGLSIAVGSDIFKLKERILDSMDGFLNDWLADNQ